MKATTFAVTADSSAHSLLLRGLYARITNRGANSVWLGGADVDNGTHGYELKTGESVEVDVAGEDLYYWASAAGTLGVMAVRRRQAA